MAHILPPESPAYTLVIPLKLVPTLTRPLTILRLVLVTSVVPVTSS